MHCSDIFQQRYWDRIHRYRQGRLDTSRFRGELFAWWAEEREERWQAAWRATRKVRCLEMEILESGELSQATGEDPRRFCRMLDRLCTPLRDVPTEESYRDFVESLFAAYRDPEVTTGEGQYIAYPPRIPIFERPLPAGGRHWYPCSTADICKQLALVPEYDLVGLWAIGLAPLLPDDRYCKATYYRHLYLVRKSVILLRSRRSHDVYKLRRRRDIGFIKQRLQAELRYGMQMERLGDTVYCRWPVESLRRFMVEHVLLHEIGHHVEYQQRARANYRRWLPSRLNEQFAEDYALRFPRSQGEERE